MIKHTLKCADINIIDTEIRKNTYHRTWQRWYFDGQNTTPPHVDLKTTQNLISNTQASVTTTVPIHG